MVGFEFGDARLKSSIEAHHDLAQRLNGSTAQRLIGKLSLLCLIGLSSLPVNIANPSPAFGGWWPFTPSGWKPSGWKICNESAASYVKVAIGYNKINAGWWSEGWWEIRRNECKSVIDVPLVRDNYYYYAKGYDSNGNWKHTWEGSIPFCIQSSRFSMGENAACLRERSIGFRKVSTGAKIDYTTVLTSS